MATKIVTKNSSTASAVPTASDLVQGELAVNVADKRLFTENNAGAIVELGTNPYNFTANHNGAVKLATTSTGIDVTGTATMDGLTMASGSQSVIGVFGTSGLQMIGQTGAESIIGTMGANEPLVLRTGSTERMRIDSSGNVGIGCVPQSKLDIDVAVDTSLGLRSQTGVIVAQYTGAPAVGNRAQIGLGYGNTYTNVSIGAVRTSAAAYGTDDFIIATKSGTANTAPTERMRIDSAGNLLVGTTNPAPVSNNVVGVSIRNFGEVQMSTNNQGPLYLNRKGTDGAIVTLRKENVDVGSIGTSGGKLDIDGPSNNSGLRFHESSLIPRKNGDVTNGQVDLGYNDGSTILGFRNLTLSGGVYLGGTGAANKLDDYEEGTWTPASIAGVSLTVNAAVYTKIGRVVYIGMAVVFASNTNSSPVQFSGLPFAVRNQSDQAYGATIANTDVGRDNIYFAFLKNTAVLGIANNLNSDVANSVYSGKKLCLSGFYFTDE